MLTRWFRSASLAWLVFTGCAAGSRAPAAAAPPSASAVASALPIASASPIAGASPIPSAAPPPPSNTPSESAAHACGALDCLAFATPEAAFAYVLQGSPRVLAIGEAHAQQGMPGIHSSTRRFAEQLLPLLRGKSKHLVIELLLAHCQQETVAAVAQQQARVTEHQAQGNQNEFLTLGKIAKQLGIEPQALSPDCVEYEAIVASGDDGVARLLELIARTTSKAVEELLAHPESPPDIVLSYGGALHNDLYPRPGREAWSFGPKLAADTHGRYIELDLIVPEFVKDTEAWRTFPWFQAFDREHLSEETLLYRPGPGSYALIFPKSSTPATQGL